MKRRKKMMMAAALIAALSVCACAKEEKPNQFTGEGTQEPEYQACLDMILPAAYNNVQGLNLEPGTYISLIGKEESSAYWKEFARGAAQAADDLNNMLGYTGNDKIKVIYNGAAKSEDIDEQVNILDEELSRYPDVLGMASIDEDACGVQLDLAISNGIPLIAFDSGNVHQGILCTVKTNNVEAARTGAYKLSDEIGGQGEVILLVQDSESESARERAESFLNEMRTNHPEIQVVETIYLDKLQEYKKQIVEEKVQALQQEMEENAGLTQGQPGEPSQAAAGEPGSAAGSETGQPGSAAGSEAGQPGDGAGNAGGVTGTAADQPGDEEASKEISEEEKAEMVKAMSDEEVFLYYLEKYPDLKGMFGTSELATQTGLAALKKAEHTESVSLMGFDAGTKQIEALKNGEIDGLVVQNPFGMGYASVVAAARTVLEQGNEAQVDTGFTWVTQENMEEDSIQKMLYE